MKKINKNKARLIVALISLLLLCSCEKLVTVEGPAHSVNSGNLFASEAGFNAALRGMYADMVGGNLTLMNGGPSVYLSMYADDLLPGSSSVNYQAFYQNNVLSSNTVVTLFWNMAYYGIYRANLMLEQLEGVQFLSSTQTNDYKGQALFMRALYHFYLWQLFGDVPLVLNTDYAKNAVLGRTDAQDVISQIITDLEEASQVINKDLSLNKAFVNYHAVQAFLARVYLYTRFYEKSVLACNNVIAEPKFQLESIDKVFKVGNREAIWQLTSEYRNVAEARSFLPASATSTPLFYLQKDLLQQFEPHDLRQANWIGTNTVGGMSYSYPTKYKDKNNGAPITEYYSMFRLAEVYLIRAEALIALGRIDDALKDLKAVRQRAGLTTESALSEDEVDKLMKDERRRELFCEWGHRWFDLKRWGLLDDVLGVLKPSYKTHAMLLPLPYSQIQTNVLLKQNKGYDE